MPDTKYLKIFDFFVLFVRQLQPDERREQALIGLAETISQQQDPSKAIASASLLSTFVNKKHLGRWNWGWPKALHGEEGDTHFIA